MCFADPVAIGWRDHRKLVAPDPQRHFADFNYRTAKGSLDHLDAGPAECSPRVIPDRYCSDSEPVKPVPELPIMRLLP